jgi:methyl-accepting chemotaxis protein
MKVSQKFGLTARLLMWFLFIGIVPSVVIGFFGYQYAQKALESKAVDTAEFTTNQLGQKVSIFFEGELNDVKMYALESVFSSGDVLKIQDDLAHTLKVSQDFQELFFIDTNGIIIASTDEKTIGLDRSKDIYFTETRNTGKAFLKETYLSETSKEIGYVISAPVYNEADQFVGVVAGRANQDKFNAIAKYAGSLKSKETYLVNADGYFITEARFAENATLNKKITTPQIKNCLEGQSYAGRSVDYRGTAVIGSYSNKEAQSVLGKNWCLVSEIDQSEAFAATAQLAQTVMLILLMAFFAILILSFFAARTIGEFVRKPIRRAVEQMTAAASQLGASTQQTSAASQQNSSIAQQLASGAMQQSRQAEEISKGVSELSAALQQMSAFAQEASASATLSSKMVQKTGEDSEKISEMVETITNIAEQTNMLALNAAIEAARAGEAGRGFAVVADEVRKLAESSGQSADEIKKIVHDIGGSMNETVKSVQDVSKRIAEVATAIQQQAAGVTQIAKTMDSIAAVSEQNASGAQQLSASTQQQSAANQQVAAAAQQLQSLSNQLQLLAGGMKDLEKHISTTAAPLMQKSKTTQIASKPSSEQKAGK